MRETRPSGFVADVVDPRRNGGLQVAVLQLNAAVELMVVEPMKVSPVEMMLLVEA